MDKKGTNCQLLVIDKETNLYLESVNLYDSGLLIMFSVIWHSYSKVEGNKRV